MSGIFRPRQGIARVCANAGNRGFICGGTGAGRNVHVVTPHDAQAEPVPFLDRAAAAVRKVARKVREPKE